MSAPVCDTETEEATATRLSIERLYRKYSGALRNFLLLRRVNRDEVADIVQETYCRILKSSDLTSIRHPKAFIFRVANNVALNAIKRRSRVGNDPLDPEAAELVDEQASPYRQLKAEQELAVVSSALLELPDACREVFLLNRFEDRSYFEIAQELGLSVSMIEKHMSHALAHLRKRVMRAKS